MLTADIYGDIYRTLKVLGVNLTPKNRVYLICNFFHPKFDFQPELVYPFCRAVNLIEREKSVKSPQRG